MKLFNRKEASPGVEEPVEEAIQWPEEPEFGSNILNQSLYYWLQPLFNRAAYLHRHGKALQQEDLAPLASTDKTKAIEDRFEQAYRDWDPKKKPEDPKKQLESRLLHALWAVCRRRMLVAAVIRFFNTVLQFCYPILLNEILKFFEDTQAGLIPPDSPPLEVYRGYWLSGLLLVFITSKALTESSYLHKVNRSGFQVKAAISAAVFSKSLRLASSELHSTTQGEMVNLMQIDATKLEGFVPQLHVLWDGIFQIAGYMTILGFLIGWPCVIGLIILLLAGPVMAKIMGKLYATNRSMVKHTDDRVKNTNEILTGVRFVKMYTWEESFQKVIGGSRGQEMKSLRKVAVLRGFARAYMTALPSVAAVGAFLTFAFATDRAATASILFSSLVAFDQLRFPLMMYPNALAQLAQAKVSLGRLAIFLGMKEVASEGHTRADGDGEIKMKDVTVYWRDPNIAITKSEADDKSLDKSEHTKKSNEEEELVYPKAVLSDINVIVKPGDLCAVVGRVGSGKSSMVSALLNETVLDENSSISVHGKVAYVAQSAWIMNQTVRENILFGKPYDEDKYNRIIDACQLKHDLDILDDGDMTEIGERGINLSGGQKQRISVARAAYADADLIIMDDPLSALDPEVAKLLFEECILGVMKDKTRLLVTNQLQCLPKCDTVVALAKGRIVEQGTYTDLMAADDGEIHRLLTEMKDADQQAQQDVQEKSKSEVANVNTAATEKAGSERKKAGDQKDHEAKALTSKEEREVGAVKMGVYLKYLKAGGGFFPFAFVYLFFILSTVISVLVTVSISLWTSDPTYERRSEGFYLGLYALMAVLLGAVTFIRSYFLAVFGVTASKNLHKNLLQSILNAPMSFFDTTPTGRILSRFSKDMHVIDQELSNYLDFVLFMTLSLIFTLFTIVYATPWFGIVLIPLIIVYVRILNYFREVSRETKRLESLSRSPVYAHFSETLGGLATIRAYGQREKFIIDFDEKLDLSTQAIYCNMTSDRWLAVRLEMIGAFVAGLAAVFSTQVVVSGAASGGGGNEHFASLAGLSLSYAIGVTGMLNWVVRMLAQVEAAMNSCERVFYYSEQIPQEAPSTGVELEQKAKDEDSKSSSTVAVLKSGGKAIYPPSEWPTSGDLQLKNLKMRYREETPLVLKGLDVSIASGEKIGVVGRTGSGKSSLLLCLMRIVEPELDEDAEGYEPPLTMDGVDVLRIGLRELRSKLGIIPQSPVLFSGTIRSNMDPFDDFSDEDIWSALEQCGMKEAVLAMSDELNAPVAEYGDNLSQGQRQLLCMGRALLKESKVLLLDEATSSVDFETDREIQRTIREAFKKSTVLTIAHRVDTIMDSDKILVMKEGVAVEFAPPQELLKDENSQFSLIVKHSKAENNGQ